MKLRDVMTPNPRTLELECHGAGRRARHAR